MSRKMHFQLNSKNKMHQNMSDEDREVLGYGPIKPDEDSDDDDDEIFRPERVKNIPFWNISKLFHFLFRSRN